jgi:hypothetical protein
MFGPYCVIVSFVTEIDQHIERYTSVGEKSPIRQAFLGLPSPPAMDDRLEGAEIIWKIPELPALGGS